MVAVCGFGDPEETKRIPQDSRCLSCPHTEASVEDFNTKYAGQYKIDYILAPCDGSIVTGIDDIGCMGHRNEKGHLELANFLTPKL
jgi:hypothetical protein